MWIKLKQLFATPTFSDPDQALAARWLKIALAILSVALIGLIGTLGVDTIPDEFFGRLLVIDCISLGAIIACWLLLKRGKIRLSASLLIIVVFLLNSYTNLAIFRSIYSPVTMTFFTLIPLAHLLLGKRGMILVTIYSMVVLTMTFYVERTNGSAIPANSERTYGELALLLASILVTTVMLNAVSQRLEENAAAIQQSVTALATANTQLQLSQVQLRQAQYLLEERVRQRTADLEAANHQLEKEVAERQRGVEALRTSEAHWRSLVENVPEVIATLTPTGVIQFTNQTVDKRPPATLIGASAMMLHTRAEARQQLQHAMLEVLQTGEAVSYESEETTEQGVRWQINRLGAIQEEGKVTALILIAADITEQKQTQTALYQSQKLESLGMLAGGVAHDFNNLLTAMLIQLSSALLKLPEDHPVRPNLQKSMKASERAAELTRQMLNYAGRTPAEIKPVDLNDLLTDNIHLFSAAITKNIRLISELSNTIPLVQGDKSQLQQLFMNLILNAADAIGDQNGTICVQTSFYELSAEEVQYWRWTGDALPAGNYARVEVQDNGCGMDASTLTKIFDPFFTTKFTGRGLGLASVLGIVRTHRGGLHVTSTVGQGTTFSLLFPALQTPLQPLDQAPAVELVTLPAELVLLIEDEEDVREATAAILREAGLQVLTATDGPPGINLFREHATEIKLVLLDLAMPEMNGADVLYKLKAINPAVPVILVSGYDEASVKDRLVAQGLATFLQKPYAIDILLQQVQERIQASEPVVA